MQLTSEEKQKVVTECDHLAKLRFSPHRRLAYTEHGAIMAAKRLSANRESVPAKREASTQR